jgi:hypothetical protein
MDLSSGALPLERVEPIVLACVKALGLEAVPDARRHRRRVTPDFPKKTKCISYVHQDQVYTHMIDVMSEISITTIKTYKS